MICNCGGTVRMTSKKLTNPSTNRDLIVVGKCEACGRRIKRVYRDGRKVEERG